MSGMKLLALCQDPQGPVVRHRVRAVVPYLREAGFADVEVRAIPDAWARRRAALQAARGFDVVLLVRKLFTGWDLGTLRSAARRLAYDFDDAVSFRDPSRRRASSTVRRGRFRNVVRAADVVLAGNAYLAGLAAECAPSRAPVVVAPTPVDTARYVPPASRPRGARRIGWIGSRSTLPYLRAVAGPLAQVLAARPDARFTVLADVPPDLPCGVEFVPWSEDAEVPWLQSLAVGIMPLSDDPWSRGKCGFKLLQYMACGVPAVASPVGANVGIAAGGEAALLAADDAAWIDALSRLLDDAAAAADLGERGREATLRRHAVAVLGPRYAAALVDCARREVP